MKREQSYTVYFSSGEVHILYDRPYLTKEDFKNIVRTILFDMEMFPHWGKVYKAEIYRGADLILIMSGQLYEFSDLAKIPGKCDGFTVLWLTDIQKNTTYYYRSPNLCTHEYFLKKGYLEDVL